MVLVVPRRPHPASPRARRAGRPRWHASGARRSTEVAMVAGEEVGCQGFRSTCKGLLDVSGVFASDATVPPSPPLIPHLACSRTSRKGSTDALTRLLGRPSDRSWPLPQWPLRCSCCRNGGVMTVTATCQNRAAHQHLVSGAARCPPRRPPLSRILASRPRVQYVPH